MRAIAVSFLLILLSATVASACELGVYTYDSIAGKGGLGPKIFPAFERLSGCKIRVIASGDAVQLLGRVEIDIKRGKPQADILLGIDNLLWERALPLTEKFSLDRAVARQLEPVIRENLSKFPGLVPYDFGALSLMVDEKQLSGKKPPGSLQDLLAPQWRRNLIFEDPRTSSPGLQFVLFTKAVLGARFASYWKKLRSQWLTMPEGWDAAYGLFLSGQAPLAWSYVTSEAYHREHVKPGESAERYRAILFREGQPVQIEGAAVVRGASQPELAKKFLGFLLSKGVQEKVAETNWMKPVLKGIQLPQSFLKLPSPKKYWVLTGNESAAVLKEWSEAIH